MHQQIILYSTVPLMRVFERSLPVIRPCSEALTAKLLQTGSHEAEFSLKIAT